MNTPTNTPTEIAELLPWECFSDPSYYDMWCVRRVGERTFGQGFHLVSGDEAKALCDMLNTRPTTDNSELIEREPVAWLYTGSTGYREVVTERVIDGAWRGNGWTETPLYTLQAAAALEASAPHAWREGRDAAAKVCEERAKEFDGPNWSQASLSMIAALNSAAKAIRTLEPKP